MRSPSFHFTKGAPGFLSHVSTVDFIRTSLAPHLLSIIILPNPRPSTGCSNPVLRQACLIYNGSLLSCISVGLADIVNGGKTERIHTFHAHSSLSEVLLLSLWHVFGIGRKEYLLFRVSGYQPDFDDIHNICFSQSRGVHKGGSEGNTLRQ